MNREIPVDWNVIAALEDGIFALEHYAKEYFAKAARQSAAQNAALLRKLADELRQGSERAAGAAEERARVVAWLLAETTWPDGVNCTMAMNNTDARNLCRWLAAAIASGAHERNDDAD
jgi:hypothetical protein